MMAFIPMKKNQQTVLRKNQDTASFSYVTKRSRALLSKSINLGHKFMMHPYVWNAKLQQCEMTTSKARFFVWQLNALGTFCYWAFVVCRFVQTALNETASAKQTVLSFFALTLFVLPVLIHLTFYMYGTEITGVINHGLKMFQGELL